MRGFLGLAGYYRCFLKNYGLLAPPLTSLLNKDSFQWSDAAASSFQSLKVALSTAPVLHLPDFSKPFIVDCDASGMGFGAVLHQGDGPLAFYSRPFAARHMKIAAYERELIGLVQVVRHWRPYLWGRQFIRTDHYALKFMLDQRLSTVPQHQWVSKLFGFDFSVEYKPGRLNTVADALSRRDQQEHHLAVISSPSFQLLDDIRQEINKDIDLRHLRDNIVTSLGEPWHTEQGLILKGKRVYIPQHSATLPEILQISHTLAHEGIQKTLQRLRRDFVLDSDRIVVRDLVRCCTTYQHNKTEALHPAGLLQPLEVPDQIWSDISLDLVEGLLKVNGKSVILTVVDRFSKFAHFIPLAHPYTAASVARAFFNDIVRLHGFPQSIVSDRDPIFTGHVCEICSNKQESKSYA